MIRKQATRCFATTVALAALALGEAPDAFAQPAASLDRHHAAVLSTDGFGVDSAETTGNMRFGANVQLDYANDPAVFEVNRSSGPDNTEGIRVVANQLRGHFIGSLTIAHRLVVFVGLPIDFVLDGVDHPVSGDVPQATGFNLGDPFIGGRLRLLGTTDDTFMLAVQGSLSAPLASELETPTYSGDRSLSARLHVLPQLNLGILRLVLDVGANLRKAHQYPDAALESEFAYGLSATIRPDGAPVSIVGEVRGGVALRRPGDREETPLELIGGARYHHDSSGITAGVAGGLGLTNALGTPEWRLLATVGWQRPTTQDSDDDGILDDDDACVDSPEDMDGNEDTDGCPDDDDGDGIADAVDECRNEAEDIDQFEDENGCPDPDNDRDNILDAADQCPNEAEDIDQFEDENGCPEPDNDHDNVLDGTDGAPNDPEDPDGFQDTDGVPELDNDADGTFDGADRCPTDAGPQENQGCPDLDRDSDTVVDRLDNCPDEAGTPANHGCREAQLVQIQNDQLVILEKVFFQTGRAAIQRRSFRLLDNVVEVLRSHPEILHVRIEGHTDNRGNVDDNMRLSQQRAQAVLDYLVAHGIEAGRLRAIGFGPSRPIVPNATSRADLERNRRVEFVIEHE